MKINSYKKGRLRFSSLPSSTYIFIILFVVFSATVKNFMTPANISAIMVQSSVLVLISIGAAFPIMTGGIDLSAGGVISLSGVMMATLLNKGIPDYAALPLGLLAGTLYGAANGILIHKVKIPPFIATFGSMGIAESLAAYLSHSRIVYWKDNQNVHFIEGLKLNIITIWFGKENSSVFTLSCMVLFVALAAAVMILLFKKTALGANIYAIGHNSESARLSGIHVLGYSTAAYAISGLMAALAGMLLIIRTNSATPTMGVGMEFQAIVAATIGGNVAEGGKGSLLGAILGAFAIYSIRNAVIYMGLSSFTSMIITGITLLMGMVINEAVAMQDMKRGGQNMGEEFNMVFIAKSGQLNFFTEMMDAAELAAGLLPNVNIKCLAPETAFNMEEQIQIIEQAIVDGADAVICTAADSTAMAEGVKKCNDAGVLYVAPNTRIDGGETLTWIGIEYYDVGYTLAKALCDKLGGEGNVVIFENVAGNQTTEDRLAGFKAAIAEYPGITILDSQPADHDREKGMSVMENYLQKYDKIDGTLATSKDMTLGAIEAAKAAGRNEEITHVTFDIDNDVLAAIRDGEVYATGDQNGADQAALAVFSAYEALNGYVVSREQFLGVTLVTKDNVEAYLDTRQ